MIASLIASLIMAVLILWIIRLKARIAVLSRALDIYFNAGVNAGTQRAQRTISEQEKAAYIQGLQDAHHALKTR